jgi:osmoprotectant transport system ATP-binding protein
LIKLKGLVKQFAGAPRPAVDHLDLDVAAGEVCVLIGPSGCGKTTTMRMVNRLIEPTSGTIEVNGHDVTHMNPVELRRGIGYVIQQVGLFPHMTIAANIATVPHLLGWDETKVARRIDELLQLIGMEPESFRDRYPRELSGGQRQRIGVARALAADPPVLLMDEPFGAIDPINRARVQDEFLKIQRQLKKTVVFVTHDIDEAIKMGDRIALLRDGRLVQQAPPAEMLARPANGFVEDFVGADRALKRLSLITCVSLANPGSVVGAPEVSADTSARDGLAVMLESGARAINLAGGGVVRLEDFFARTG